MPDEPPIKRTIAFVDGQNLFHAAKEAFGFMHPNYDIQALAQALCSSKGWQLDQVRFYTGYPDAADNAAWNHFWIAKLAQMEGRTVKEEPTPEKGFYYRSDHFSFAKLGVPMVYFEGGDDLVNGGKEAAEKAAKDYEENRYHAPGDEFDESWDWSGVMADLRLYYRVGRMLAMTTAWPNWVEGDEFRAIRDKSRAAK